MYAPHLQKRILTGDKSVTKLLPSFSVITCVYYFTPKNHVQSMELKGVRSVSTWVTPF